MDLEKRFERNSLKRFQVLNGAQLKYIAFISMLIDHANNALDNPPTRWAGLLATPIKSIFDIGLG